jgi:hypothetical protein
MRLFGDVLSANLDDDDDPALVCTPEEAPPPAAWLHDDDCDDSDDDATVHPGRSSARGAAHRLARRDAAEDAVYEPSRAELRHAARAMGFPSRAGGVGNDDNGGGADPVAVAARRALTKAQRVPYERLTDPADYAQLERMLAHWGLAFPPGFDAAALAARVAAHPLGVSRVHLKLPTRNADGDVCETASIDDIRRGKSIHLTAAERAASTRRRAEANRVAQPPGSRRDYETERVGIELFMRFVGHADDAVQLLEHRIFDAAVPVQGSVPPYSPYDADPEARYAAFAFKTNHVKDSGSLAVKAGSWLAYLERGGAVAVVAYEPGAAEPHTVWFVPPTPAAIAWCRGALAGSQPGGAGRASLSLSPHGAGVTGLERWRHDVGVPMPARDEHDAERALSARLTLRRAVRAFLARARTFTLEELNYDADMLPSVTHRMENASFQSLRRSLAAHQPAYWLEKRSNEHVDFCLMRRGGDDHGTPHVVCRIQAKNLGAKVRYDDDDDDADAAWSASLRAPRRLYYHPDAVDALVLHVPRAQNMTARRKCDPDAWTGVLVQPLRASAWDCVGASPSVDPLLISLTVPTLDGVCRLDTPDGCAPFVARCVVAAATPKLAHGEVARLHNRWLAMSARERAAAEARRVARERLAAESRRRARAGEAGLGRAAKCARCDDPPTADAADGGGGGA